MVPMAGSMGMDVNSAHTSKDMMHLTWLQLDIFDIFDVFKEVLVVLNMVRGSSY